MLQIQFFGDGERSIKAREELGRGALGIKVPGVMKSEENMITNCKGDILSKAICIFCLSILCISE